MRKSMLDQIGRRRWAVAAASTALAVGGIVLLKAPGQASPRIEDDGQWRPVIDSGGTNETSFEGPVLSGTAALTQGAVVAGGTREVLADLRLSAAETAEVREQRHPVAIAVVMDVSGSMAGDKIIQSRDALRRFVERMHDDDYVAIVTYNHATQVVQPLSRVGDVRTRIPLLAAEIYAGGGTMIPQALHHGASLISSAPSNLVRRMVLISDGIDGSGQTVEAVSSAVRGRAASGTAVSSLGIGTDYDERFLTSVADAGRGNYAFLATGIELQGFLQRELNQASTTVVDSVTASLTLPTGWRLSRAYGGEARGNFGTVSIPFGPMFAGDKRRVVLALSVDAGAPGELGALGLRVSYRTVSDNQRHDIAGGQLALRAVEDETLALATRNPTRYAESQAVVIDADQQEAVEAWRSGDVSRARRMSRQNVASLRDLAAAAPEAAPQLEMQVAEFEADEGTFGAQPAASSAGRAYGLQRNAARRERVRVYQ